MVELIFVFIIIIVIIASIVSYTLSIGKVKQDASRVFQRVLAFEQNITTHHYAAQQKELKQTIASVERADLAASGIEETIKNLCLIPIPAEPTLNETSTAAFGSLVDIVSILDKHAVAVAGIEQVIYNMLDVPHLPTIDQFVLTYYGGLLPSDLQSAAKDIISSIQDGHLLGNIAAITHSASQIINQVIALDTSNIHESLDLIQSLANDGSLAEHFLDTAHQQIYRQALSDLIAHSAGQADILNFAEHMQHVDTSASQIINHLSSIHAHFPWITAIVAISREISLLSKDKTSLDRSVKHIAIKVSGTGIGGAMGAKAGAAAGAFVGSIVPVVGTAAGAVGGAIIGGVGGAIAGRSVANKKIMQKLCEAVEHYNTSYESLQRETTNTTYQVLQEIKLLTSVQQQALIQCIGSVPHLNSQTTPKLIEMAEKLRLIANIYLQDAQSCVDKALEYAGNESLNRLFTFQTNIGTSLTLIQANINAIKQKLPSEIDVRTKPIEALQRLATIEVPQSNYEHEIRQTTKNLQEILHSYLKSVMQWSHDATAAYGSTTKSLKPAIEASFEKYRRVCEFWIQEVKQAEKVVIHEKEVLGMA